MYLKEKFSSSPFTFNKIRLLKFLEIIQYTFIVLIITVLVCLLYNKIFIHLKSKRQDTSKKKRDSKKKIISKFLLLFVHTSIVIILIYYIRKFSLVFPSLSKMIYSDFKEHTTSEYVFHIALFISFIELIPEYKNLFRDINEALFSKEDIKILYSN